MGNPAALTWRRPPGLRTVFNFGNSKDDKALFYYFYLPHFIFVWVELFLVFILFNLKLKFVEESSF